MEITWNADSFRALLLVYAAHTDDYFGDNEQMVLEDLFEPEVLEQAQKFYRVNSEFKVIQTLSTLKETFYPGNQGSEVLQRELHLLYEADGKFSTWEHIISNQLRRLLN